MQKIFHGNENCPGESEVIMDIEMKLLQMYIISNQNKR